MTSYSELAPQCHNPQDVGRALALLHTSYGVDAASAVKGVVGRCAYTSDIVFAPHVQATAVFSATDGRVTKQWRVPVGRVSSTTFFDHREPNRGFALGFALYDADDNLLIDHSVSPTILDTFIDRPPLVRAFSRGVTATSIVNRYRTGDMLRELSATHRWEHTPTLSWSYIKDKCDNMAGFPLAKDVATYLVQPTGAVGNAHAELVGTFQHIKDMYLGGPASNLLTGERVVGETTWAIPPEFPLYELPGFDSLVSAQHRTD